MVSITIYGSLLPKYAPRMMPWDKIVTDSEYIKCLCEKTGLITVKGTVTLVLIIIEVTTIQFELKFMVSG